MLDQSRWVAIDEACPLVMGHWSTVNMVGAEVDRAGIAVIICDPRCLL